MLRNSETQYHVLLIDDSPECGLILRRTFANSGITLSTAGSYAEAETALKGAKSKPVQLVLLDLGLPDKNGMSLLEESCASADGESLPFFLLTVDSSLGNKLTAFGLGAEDYIIKPFDPLEVRARVEMRLRKIATSGSSQRVLKRGPLLLKLSSMRAVVLSSTGEQEIELTSKEFKILSLLASQEGEELRRRDIIEAIWGKSVHVLDRTVDSHIYQIRKKLKNLGDYIEAIPGHGYRFMVRG